MPWTPKDATHSTKKAKSSSQKKKWAEVANAVLKKTGNDALAKRTANKMILKGKKNSDGATSRSTKRLRPSKV